MWLSQLSGEQQETMLRLAHNVIVSDGLLDPNEEGMLEAFRREMGVSTDFQVEYLELEGISRVFSERKERLIVLMNLCKLSYADGAFEIEEECLINEIRKAFDVSEAQFDMLQGWIKRMTLLESEGAALLELS
jgi:tellurite resistance protein|tara:strand:+ start:737 stop:1135 length:399 start_codon:yes stop_codon:yes gene_type:complete